MKILICINVKKYLSQRTKSVPMSAGPPQKIFILLIGLFKRLYLKRIKENGVFKQRPNFFKNILF